MVAPFVEICDPPNSIASLFTFTKDEHIPADSQSTTLGPDSVVVVVFSLAYLECFAF